MKRHLVFRSQVILLRDFKIFKVIKIGPILNEKRGLF